jgi:hypothetical protein
VLVFISYARDDVSHAHTVAGVLETAGHEVWIDRVLLPGQTWKEVLREQIEACDRFVVVLTSDALASPWCTWELVVANRAGKPIVPVLCRRGGEPPALLRTLHHADFTEGAGPAASRSLLDGLTAATPSTPDLELPSEAPPSELGQPYYRRHFSDGIIAAQFDLRATGEQILAKQSAARIVYGLVQVGGRLTLTDRRLLFEAHAFNVRKERLEIGLGTITAVRAIHPRITRAVLSVETTTERTHRFFTGRCDQLAELIEQYR